MIPPTNSRIPTTITTAKRITNQHSVVTTILVHISASLMEREAAHWRMRMGAPATLQHHQVPYRMRHMPVAGMVVDGNKRIRIAHSTHTSTVVGTQWT